LRNDESLISVVIPAYNCEATITRTLDSLARQTYGGWEAIVVDDGSVDGTARLVEGYRRDDDRIRLHSQANRGVSAARNTGIRLARNSWLFLLDADDWILPTAFAGLLDATSAHPDVDAVYAGYVRVDEKGREMRERRPDHSEDLFPVFTRMCAFAIHTCLIRIDLVRSVGGFDESLVTCEDWDLWQRVARAGARFAAIPDYIAYYGMRSGSASANGARMLSDGLKVIARGHSEDTRLTTVNPKHRHGVPASRASLARAYFACYAAGLVVAEGMDARWMLDELGEDRPTDLDPGGIAETLFLAVPNGRATAPEEWQSFPPPVLERCREFIDAIGEWMHDSWLGFRARAELERLILDVSEGPKPRTVGAWHLMDLDCDGDPPAHVDAGSGVEHLLCTIEVGERELGTIELPTCEGWVSPRVLADSIAEKHAWEVLDAWLTRHVYPTLEIERTATSARVSRSGATLLEDKLPPSDYPFERWLHDRIGWTILLQEVWDRPGWDSDRFYANDPDPGQFVTVAARAEEPVEVEVTQPLPVIACTDWATVGATLAGVPLVTLRLGAREGIVQPHEIRRGVLMRLGFEFCRAVVRELILAPAMVPGASLRDMLARAAERRADVSVPSFEWVEGVRPRSLVPGWQGAMGELLPPTRRATVIGRRAHGADGTGVSRYLAIPRTARAEMLEGAGRGGDPVLELDGSGHSSCVVYAPCVQWDRASCPNLESEDESLLAHLEFEQVFASQPDPWHYESDYEQKKYDQTLALVPDRISRALEVGCAEGIFTAKLAEKVDLLTACDISTVALSRAARRCSHLPNVDFVCLDAFQDELPGRYDLIVCSEMLYYARSEQQLIRTLRRFGEALLPQGLLLTANAHTVVDDEKSSGFDWDIPFGAKRIGEAIASTRAFELIGEVRTEPYRIQLHRRRAQRSILPTRLRSRKVVTQFAQPGEMSSEAASRFLREGGKVRVEKLAPVPPSEAKVPILMYHRIAEEGAAATQRWRTRPDDFERQLELLRAGGYYSVSFEQWRAAANMRRALPGKPIILTFDDGYADFPNEVAPRLRRYGFGATVFLVSELVGLSNLWDRALGESIALMGWDVIGELAREGIDFGSHSARHRPLVTLDQGELARDLASSRSLLEERLERPVTSVCYPFGLRDAAVESIAGACGYEYGVTTDEWRASWADRLIALPRLEVRGTDTLDDFAALLES
jgi:peptidoglycan/xylan/chitin deacetylase (PgdA/CDA1 family)/protein-L-isoaspartate O-methyltransferase